MLKILIADDHAILREGIIKSLSEHFSDAKFAEAGNSKDVMDLISMEKWDLIILDINMPGRGGLDILKEVKETYPDIIVVVLSMYPEDQFAVRVIKAGASAYLTKDASHKELITAIKTVLNKEQYITPSIARLLTEELRDGGNKPPHSLLSDREFQVMILIASGKSISIIADELSLSVKTISVYRANALRKMNLKNNSEITHYAFKNNLVDK